MSLWTDAVMARKPTGFWRMDERVGTKAADSSGNGWTLDVLGTVVLNQPSLLQADPDPAMLFGTGATPQTRLRLVAASFPSSDSWAVVILMQASSLPGNMTLVTGPGDADSNTGASTWRLEVTGTGAVVIRGSSGGVASDLSSSAGRVVAGNSYRIVATYDASTGVRRLYVNGQLVASDNFPLPRRGPGYLYIGAWGDSFNYFQGVLDECAVYAAALSTADVTALEKAATGQATSYTPPAQAPVRRYTYLFCDLRTNQVLAELPLKEVSFSLRLNGAGAFQARLPLGDDRLLDSLDPLGSSQPGRTAVYVDRDGVLVWGGIIWTRRYEPGRRGLVLGGNEFLSYFFRRRIRATLSYAAADQLDISRGIVNYIQGIPGGSIGVAVDALASGVLRDRTYYGYELRVAAEALQQLSAVDGGFDFGIDVGYAAGVPSKTLNHGYPRRGRPAAQSGHVFEYPGNILDFSYDENAWEMTNQGYAVGAGEGDAALIAPYATPSTIDAGYPVLEEVFPYRDVEVISTLQGHVMQDTIQRQQPIVLPTFDVYADADPRLGAYIVGDDARFTITDPLRFPANSDGSPGLDVFMRIIQIDVSPQEGSVEKVRITAQPIY